VKEKLRNEDLWEEVKKETIKAKENDLEIKLKKIQTEQHFK
jgi:hypothetical protein